MNSTAFLDAAQVELLTTHTPWYYIDRPSILPWLTDAQVTTINAVVCYWVFCSLFHVLDVSGWRWLEKYRIHPTGEETRNRVTRTHVLLAVLGQQVLQSMLAWWWLEEKPCGSDIDHVGEMLKLAAPLSRLVAFFLGQEDGARLLATRGAMGLYTLYWWAIPVVKLFFGM